MIIDNNYNNSGLTFGYVNYRGDQIRNYYVHPVGDIEGKYCFREVWTYPPQDEDKIFNILQSKFNSNE